MHFTLPGLNTKYDLNRATIIFASNHDEVDDEALAQRAPNIPFLGLSKGERVTLATNTLRTEVERFKKESATAENAQPRLAEKILEIGLQAVDHIVKADMSRTPGGRIIQRAVGAFVNTIERAFNDNPDSEFDQPRLKSIVDNIYASYPTEDSISQRLDADRIDPTIGFIDTLRENLNDMDSFAPALNMLAKNVALGQIKLNDEAMVELGKIFARDDDLGIADPAQQTIALDVITNLARVCTRAALTPGYTQVAMFTCLKALLSAFTDKKALNDEIRFALLDTVQGMAGMLPAENEMRDNIIEELSKFAESDRFESFKGKIMSIVDSLQSK